MAVYHRKRLVRLRQSLLYLYAESKSASTLPSNSHLAHYPVHAISYTCKSTLLSIPPLRTHAGHDVLPTRCLQPHIEIYIQSFSSLPLTQTRRDHPLRLRRLSSLSAQHDQLVPQPGHKHTRTLHRHHPTRRLLPPHHPTRQINNMDRRLISDNPLVCPQHRYWHLTHAGSLYRSCADMPDSLTDPYGQIILGKHKEGSPSEHLDILSK